MAQRPLSIAGRKLRHRTAATLGVLTLLLVGALVYFGAFLRGWLPDSLTPDSFQAKPTAESTPTKAPVPENYEIKVNVYNSTDRTGLAAAAADRLREQGYSVGMVSNDPLKKKVTNVAVVRYGKKGAPHAKLVLSRLKGATAEVDSRQTRDIDLVLGDKFQLSLIREVVKAEQPTTRPTGG